MMVSRHSSKDQDEVAAALAGLLATSLKKGRRVLWLVSGGSSLPIAFAVSEKLKLLDMQNLFVTLVDDKYGAPEEGTNWHQLLDLGFHVGGSQGILRPGLSLAETAARFNRLLQERLAWADVSIGQFGLGEGYHTGGIMAGSPAARARKLAIGYEHQGQGKITVTPALIKKLDVAFINSMGEGKRPLVQHFLQSQAAIVDEPTQSLKTARQTLLYSDVL